jgi:hypothetical protein
MIYVKYLAVCNNDPQLARLLVNYSRNIAYEKGYSFVAIGMHEKDIMNKVLHGMMKLTFRSVGLFVSIKNNSELIMKLKQGIPFEDYSLV